MQSYNLTFADLKSTLNHPSIKDLVNPELLENFDRATTTLIEGDAFFLYELAKSILDTGGANHLLQKKIAKNSPFGKFLRTVLLNIRKMSYPQILHLYQNLLDYVGVSVHSKSNVSSVSSSSAAPSSKSVEEKLKKTPKKKKSTGSARKKSVGRKSIPNVEANVNANTPILKCEKSSQIVVKSLDRFQKLSDEKTRKNNPMTNGLNLELFSLYVMDLKISAGVFPPHAVKSMEKYVKDKETRIAKAVEASKGLNALWNKKVEESGVNVKMEMPDSSKSPKRRSKRLTPSKRKSCVPKSPSKGRPPYNRDQELVMLDEWDDGYCIRSEDEEHQDHEMTNVRVFFGIFLTHLLRID